MSYLLPFRDTTKDDRRQFRKLLTEALMARALSLGLVRKQEELVIRDLLLADLGLSDGTVPVSSPHQSVKFVPKRYLGQVVIGIYKVLQLGTKPRATTLTFPGKGGKGKDLTFPLDLIYGEMPLANALTEHLERARKEAARNITYLSQLHPVSSSNTGSPEPEVLLGPMEGYFTDTILYDPQDPIEINVEVREDSDDYLVLGGLVCERL